MAIIKELKRFILQAQEREKGKNILRAITIMQT